MKRLDVGRLSPKSSGFLLVEVLVSVLLLSIGLVVLLDSIKTSIDSNIITQERTKAIALAQQMMWDVENRFYWQSEDVDYDSDGEFAVDPDYSYKVDVEPDTERSEALIVVTVSWIHQRVPKTYSLVSVVPLERDKRDFKDKT